MAACSRFVRFVLCCLLAWVAACGPAFAQSPLPAFPSLTVRLYDVDGVAAADLDLVQREATALFRAAGVRLAWRRCDDPRTNRVVDPCTDVLRPSEVIVRLMQVPADAGRAAGAFGYSLVDPRTRAGAVATIFSDRVIEAAARLHSDPAMLLGRALAHEVGHLLLGHGTQSDAGLMRAHWSDDLIRDGSTSDWQFAAADGLQLVPAARARAARAAALIAAGPAPSATQTYASTR